MYLIFVQVHLRHLLLTLDNYLLYVIKVPGDMDFGTAGLMSPSCT